MTQTRIKRPPLSQSIIDAPAKPSRRHATWKEALEYVDGVPGIVLTIVVLIAFAVGMYFFFALWGSAEVLKAVDSAGRG